MALQSLNLRCAPLKLSLRLWPRPPPSLTPSPQSQSSGGGRRTRAPEERTIHLLLSPDLPLSLGPRLLIFLVPLSRIPKTVQLGEARLKKTTYSSFISMSLHPCLFLSGLEAVHFANVHSATAECECRTHAHSSTLSLASFPPAFQRFRLGRKRADGASGAARPRLAAVARRCLCS